MSVPNEQHEIWYSLTEAAKVTGVSRSKIRKYLDAKKFPNAEQDDKGVWHVPKQDILRAELTIQISSLPARTPVLVTQELEIRKSIGDLATALSGAVERAAVAETRLDFATAERDKAVAEAERMRLALEKSRRPWWEWFLGRRDFYQPTDITSGASSPS